MSSVLLIRPHPVVDDSGNFPTESPPIGIISLGSFLRSKGMDVSVLDLCTDPHTDVISEISRINPDVVGMSSMTCDFPMALDMADQIKRKFDIPIVFGGPHPTIFPEEVLQSPSVDFVIIGEGEHAFHELILSLKNGKTFESIASLGYKENGSIMTNQRGPYCNINTLPFPDYSFLNNEKYISFGEKYLGFRHLVAVVSRGCTSRCTFCAQHQVWGSQFRLFSPDRVVSEMNRLMREYSVEGFWFKDSVLTVKSWTIPFCEEIIKQKLDVKWACLARVDQVNKDLIRIMKKAGLAKIWIGAESGSNRILQLLNKLITADQTREAFRICKEEGVDTAAFFMFGLPTETVDEMKLTFELARETNPKPMHLAIYHPLPGTDLYDKYNGAEIVKRARPRELVFDKACMSTGPVSKELVQEIYDGICNYFIENGPEPDFSEFKKKALFQEAGV